MPDDVLDEVALQRRLENLEDLEVVARAHHAVVEAGEISERAGKFESATAGITVEVTGTLARVLVRRHRARGGTVSADADALPEIALVDVLDRLLAGGLILTGDVVLSVADVDLMRISLRALVASIEGLEPAR
jgi:hypothetical protein